MALFEGEDMVDVTTPDGRTLTLPRSIVPASMLPQQIAAPPQAPLGAPVAPPTELAPPTLPTPEAPPQSPGVVEMGEPDVYPVGSLSTVEMGEPTVKNTRQLAKDAKAKAAYNASPAGKQAAAQGVQAQADNEVREAMLDEVTVEAATNDMLAGAREQHNAEIAKAELARTEEMRENVAAQDKKMSEVITLRKKIEGTKIDRTADNPVALAIFAALAGLGSGMKGEKVNTLDLIYQAIDRKVAGQEADLDRMGKVYGMTRDEIEMLKEKSKNRLEFHNAMVAAETNKAIRTIEEITARSASARTIANGKMMIAQFEQRAADKSMEAMRWGLEYDQKATAEKNQQGRFYSDLKFRKDQHKDNLQIRREDIAADLAKALAADRAAGKNDIYKMRQEAIKENRQFGVRDMNGDFYLSPEGRAKVSEAAKLEAEAAKLESSDSTLASKAMAMNKAQLLREKAAVLRGDANSSGQSVVQLIDEIKIISDQAGRGLLTRDEAQVALRAKFNQLKPGLKEAWQLGAWDKGSAGLVAEIIGADPSSEWNAGALGAFVSQKMYENPTAFHAGLDSVAKDLEGRAKNKLAGLGTKFGEGELVFQRAEKPIPPSESAAKLQSSYSGTEQSRIAETRADKFAMRDPSTGKVIAPSAREVPESVRYLGLSKEQEAPFEERLQAYKKGDPRAADELVGLVADAAKKRPDQAIPLLHNLREHAPKLYPAARAAVPKDSEVDKQMVFEENNHIGTATLPTDMLVSGVLRSINTEGKVTDQEGYRDLVVRSANGDAIAKRALLDIVNQSGVNKTLPRGNR
jgi:hypothetical protein